MKSEDPEEIQSVDLLQKQSGIISVNKLLDRPLEQEHIEEWTQLLAKPVEAPKEIHEMAVVIFRLGNELLALPTNVFVEVAESRKVHKIPHRSNSILMGMVNVNGQLQLCIALHKLLQIELDPMCSTGPLHPLRMLLIQKNGEKWIFPCNEVFGIHYCDSIHLSNVPITVAKSSANFLRGVINWNERAVGFLDEELLFYHLNKELGFQK
jgi:chemotaxis-related protein WspD